MRLIPTLKILAYVFLCLCGTAYGSEPPRVATFRADVTPPLGQPLIWVTPASEVESPLWAKGVILEHRGERSVLCAIDWCGLSNSTYALWRRKLAAASGASESRIFIHSVHQHSAPYIDGSAYRLLHSSPEPPLMMTEEVIEALADRVAKAVKEAARRLEPFDRVGTGEAQVEGVASARRIITGGGSLVTRFSSGGKDPALAALPEGDVDTILKTITVARGEKALARLHYYASHPQTFCCDGRISGDFVSAARETLEQKEGVFQVYFTGAAGDVTAGKYNDGSQQARELLTARLVEGMEAAVNKTRWGPAGSVQWRAAPVRLPARTDAKYAASAARARMANEANSGQERYRAAIAVAFAERQVPLEISFLQLGAARVLNLPGEPMLEFQRYAQGLLPGEFVAVAGYGDLSPGYLCTDRAFEEGGYEPSASNAGPGTELRVKQTIRELLGNQTP